MVDIIHYNDHDFIFDTTKIYRIHESQKGRKKTYRLLMDCCEILEAEKITSYELHMIISERMANNVFIFYGINDQYKVNLYTIVEVNKQYGICKEN